MKYLFLFYWLLPLAVAAQDDCYNLLYARGRQAYDAGDYATALKKWEAAKGCPDKPISNDLDKRIGQAHAKMAPPKPAKPTQADIDGDALWNLVKDSEDPKTIQKFLNQYPKSRHTAAAQQRISALMLAGSRQTKPATNALSAAMAPPGFAYVQGGTFDMGDTFNDGSGEEKPVHAVHVSDFFIGKTEVTFDEYDTFCSYTNHIKPSDNGYGRGQKPVTNVDWYDALEYCNWRSEKEGLKPVYSIDKTAKDPNNLNPEDYKKWVIKVDWAANGYRLPTEAEWEYAARAVLTPEGVRGGGRVRFGNGKNIADPNQMNFDARVDPDMSYSKYTVTGGFRAQTTPVGSLNAPNALGLHDMSGNVAEWCYDWYQADYYAQSKGAFDPIGPNSGQYKCIRGGYFVNFPHGCRAAFRSGRVPYATIGLGFRLLRH